MKQVELRLIPAPGQKPEFLATLELAQKNNVHPLWPSLPAVIVLEGYTRDAWAVDTATKWTQWQVEAVDGRNKLPGFVKYLRDRQKTAYGRFGGSMVWVISHDQTSSSTLNCRIAGLNKIPNCPLKANPTSSSQASAPTSKPAAAPKPPAPTPAATAANAESSNKPKRKGFGLLGNLVGAQRRTNEQVQLASTVAPKKAPPPDEVSRDVPAGSTAVSSHAAVQPSAATEGTKTAGQVLAEFRQEMEQEMLDFDLSDEPCLKVKIDLAAKLRLLQEDEKQSGRVTMEVLKYIVYEQAEEVNEEWIAHREPSEFMDEAVIAIYKEGEAPPEVLEDVNKAELPDEIRGQQRAMQEQRQKAEQIKAQRIRMEQTKLALQVKQQQKQKQEDDVEDEDQFAALNIQKRDRRTIEDYEREAKRRREE